LLDPPIERIELAQKFILAGLDGRRSFQGE
jgi:hypothetical protein